MSFHETVQIHPSASIAESVEIGAFAVIGQGVEIGAGSNIGHHVVIHADTRIGDNVRVDDHAVLGKHPMRSKRSATTSSTDISKATIGDECLLGTGAVIYAGCTIENSVLVADYATIRERVTIGAETIVGRGVAIENDCSVGQRCKLETNVYICAYSTIGDDVFIAPGVLTSNDNFLGRTEERKKHFAGPSIHSAARLGVGSIVLPGKQIATETVIAAGAVVTNDTEPEKIHMGIPARPVRNIPSEQRLPESNKSQA